MPTHRHRTRPRHPRRRLPTSILLGALAVGLALVAAAWAVTVPGHEGAVAAAPEATDSCRATPAFADNPVSRAAGADAP